MIESVNVRNFRCYESLELHGLRRMNVVVGRNASGKTALLESIFLAAGGSPEIPMRFRAWRGMGQMVQISADRRSFESFWRDLFYTYDQERKISLTITGSEENTASLDISYSEQNVLTVPLDSKTGEASAPVFPLDFDWRDSKGKSTKGRIRFGPSGLQIDTIVDTVKAIFFASGWTSHPPQEFADRYSSLSVRDQEEAVVEAIREEFPFIKGLSIETSGGVPLLHASLVNVPGKIPLGIVSAGVLKFTYLLLSIAAAGSGAVLLVDEVENGFYYDRFQTLWSRLLRFCKNYECQLFCTCHSLECLRGMLPAIEADDKEFCLIRTELSRHGVSAEIFSGRQLESAINQEVDVR